MAIMERTKKLLIANYDVMYYADFGIKFSKTEEEKKKYRRLSQQHHDKVCVLLEVLTGHEKIKNECNSEGWKSAWERYAKDNNVDKWLLI